MRSWNKNETVKCGIALACLKMGMLVAGCSAETSDDSGDEAGNRLETGIDDDKKVGDIDTDEAGALCSEIQAAQSGDVRMGTCVWAVRGAVDDVEECNQAVDRCLSGLDDISDEELTECSQSIRSWECQATIGDFEDCAEDYFDALATIGRGGCDDAMNVSVEALDAFASPASCKRLEDSCPESFGSGGGGEVVVAGDLDGATIEIQASGYGASGFEGNGQWGAAASFGDAELRLWGDKEAAQGLLLMPERGPFASEWMCLGDLQVEPSGDSIAGAWSSSEVSSLGACAGTEGSPLELDFSLAGDLEGTFRGEEVDWTNNGYGCESSQCELSFATAAGALTLVVDLNGTSFGEEGTHEVLRAALVDTGTTGAVACGGEGSITERADHSFRVRIENFSDFAACPGEPLEGSLSGQF